LVGWLFIDQEACGVLPFDSMAYGAAKEIKDNPQTSQQKYQLGLKG
jgi:hypothetical protein